MARQKVLAAVGDGSVSCDRGLLGDDAAERLMQMMIEDHQALLDSTAVNSTH
jgi:hypothetical protein